MTNLFEKEELVQVELPELNAKMVVVDVQFQGEGWHYELAFPKKDGTPDKRKTRRMVCEAGIKKAEQ